MHKNIIIPLAESSSIELDRSQESDNYGQMLALIFDRPQKHFYVRREDRLLIPRTLLLTPAGWKLAPLDPVDYPAFVENYLS